MEGPARRTDDELLAASVAEAAPVGEFYDRQLIGLLARRSSGDVLGEIASVVHHGEQDTLVIRTGEGTEVLVPFVAEIVPTVDVAGGFVVVTDLPGLLDPENAQ